jgi:hypothetical protein
MKFNGSLVVPLLPSAPLAPQAGQVYFDDPTDTLFWYDGAKWVPSKSRMPAGGTIGQVLSKIDGTDYNTQWVAQTGGSGSGSTTTAPLQSYAQMKNGAATSQVATANAAWSTILPMPIAAGMDISASDGTNPDFERMSDGSLRVVSAGFYDVAASAAFPNGVNATAAQYNIAIVASASGTTPTINDTVVAVASEQVGHTYPTLTVARPVYLTANQRIGVFVYCGWAGSPALSMFGIGKLGGPKGDKGDAGDSDTYFMTGAAGPATASIAGQALGPFGTTGVVNSDATTFQVNGDGTLTVLKDGVYVITATSGISTGPAPADTRLQSDLVLWGVGVARTLANIYSLCTDESTAPWPYSGLSTIARLVAGQSVGVVTYADVAMTRITTRFYAGRIVGPRGATGATGGNATVPMDTWHTVNGVGEPAFLNSWVNFGSGFASAAFRKDPLGRVHLRGLVKSGTIGAAIFQLPVGYRPANVTGSGAVVDVGKSGGVSGDLRVDPTGLVTLFTGENGYVSLDGLSFDTDTVTAMPTGPQGPKGDTGGNATVPIDPWHVVGATGEPGFTNGWGTVATENSPAFYKDPLGIVRLRGTIGGGTQGLAAFTLPVGYRPSTPPGGRLRGVSINNQGATAWAQVNINGDGQVIPWGDSSQYISLDQLSFDSGTVTAMPTGPQGPKGDTGGNATVPMDTVHVVGTTGEPAFAGTWAVFDAARPPRFRKDPLGKVRLSGILKGGTIGTTAWTLPVGYRPAASIAFSSCTTSGGVIGEVDISAAGAVVPVVGGTTYFFLDGIEFDTETVTAMPTGPKGDTGATGATGGNATVPMDLWHAVGAVGEPAFANSWTNYGSGYTTLAFRKNPLGKVQLRGMIRSAGTTAGLNIFTLPTGYRPAARALFDAIAENVQARVDVNTDGSVMMMVTAATGSYLSLDGIEFDTDSIAAMPTGPQGPPGATGGNATVPMDAWHTVGAAGEPAFAAGWSNLDGAGPNQRALRFTKDPLGRVLLTGIVKGANSTVIFTLPAGYRPVRLNQIIDANASGGNAQVVVSSNGDVTATTLTGNVATYVSLDNIIFDTETVTAMPTGPQGPTGPPGNSVTVPMDTWHTLGAAGEPAFGTGWAHYGGGFQNVGFRKFPDGKVKLRGLANLASGTSTLIFTLPSGYWPPGWVLATGDSSFEPSASTVDIRVNPANGQVSIFNTVAMPVGNWLSLDSVEFDTGTVTALQTGPIGPQGPGSARMWRGLDSGIIRSTGSSAYSEIAGSSLRITPMFTGTYIEFALDGQWEHNTLSGYMAVQVMDLVTGVYVPGIYWVARAAAANQNVSYSFSSTVLASALVAGHTYAAYWSTGSGTCTARNDVTPMNFTAKEYV